MRNGLLALVLVATASSAAQPPRVTPPCDRACLEGYVDRYLDAMLANEVSPKLFARDVKFTENGVRLPLGNEGLWFGMSGKGTYKFYVPDVETQQVAFIGTVIGRTLQSRGANTGEGNLVAIGLRLKVVGGLITEVEQLAIRPETTLGGRGGGAPAPARGAGAGARGASRRRRGAVPPGGAGRRWARAAAAEPGDRVEAMKEPHPIFREAIPEAKRPSREELIETANYYFTGLARNDGKGYYPFTDDCERFENGVAMTQTNCKQQFEQTLRGIVSRIRDRRFVAVDRERGHRLRVCVLRPRADQLDVAARRALQDRERPDSPRRGGLPSRALRDPVGLEHVRAGDVGVDPERPLMPLIRREAPGGVVKDGHRSQAAAFTPSANLVGAVSPTLQR